VDPRIPSLALLAGLGLGLGLGCGGARTPEPYPVDAIRLGVDPRSEADAVVRGLASAGFSVAERLDLPRVTVLGFVRPSPPATAVRVVTSRGVAWFADAAPEGELEAVTLLARRPGGPAPDVDGDGEPEVVVLGRAPGDPRACAVVLRVARDGAVAPIRIDTSALGARVCVEDVEDVDGDGRAEAIAVARFPEASGAEPPTVALPLAIGADAVAHVCRCPAYWADVRERLDAELRSARAASEGDAVCRVAIELAAVAGRAGDPAAALAAFDEAVAGLALDARQTELVARAREVVSAGLGSRGP